MSRKTVLWIAAVVITLASATLQRMTGPSYPVRFGENLETVRVSGKLLRTHSINGDLPVEVKIEGDASKVAGNVKWRRFPTQDEWTTTPLVPKDGMLTTSLPAQPMAGKVEYRIDVTEGERTMTVPQARAAVARFKGDVPWPVLAVHIFAMFFGMLWSLRAGFEALWGHDGLPRQSLLTLIILGIGGLMLGPVVQKFAFDAYWTGWPLGEDLTDNKLAVAVVLWALAVWRVRRGVIGGRYTGAGKRWAVIAMLVTAIIFAIPHSMHGSTLDYETMEHVQG